MKNRGWARARNIILHILFLLVLLIVSILFFERLINQTVPEAAGSMENTTFPLVYMRRGNVSFNCLSGYAQEMDVSQMRDTITPLTNDRKIGIRIETFSTTVDGVSYEVLSLDGKESLENTKVLYLEKENDGISAELTLRNQMLLNQEYVLKICVTSGGRNIWYYTNVVMADGLHTDEYLNYVTGFYDKTVNRSDLSAIGAAVEPDETTDIDATLAYMDIHDSVTQLTWADLRPQTFYKPTPRLCEINNKTASLTMEYRIASVNESGITEIFNVREFYRVRYTDSRVFLLNFERTTNEVFNPENDVLSSKGLRLGITGKDVEYKADSKNKVIAFVQENELWTFDRGTRRLTQVFSFPQKENMDYRDFRDLSDIRILRVDETGDVWFAVDGYMNRGPHEGETGVALYYYDAVTAMLEEKVFLFSAENLEMMERDVNTLAYVSGDGSMFYVYLEEKLWGVSLVDRSVSSAAANAKECTVAGSDSGRYFAWLEEGEEYNSRKLNMIDLETGTVSSIEAGEDERIRPICYMNEDLVYGLAKEADLELGSLEMGYFPMYVLKIVDGSGEEIKTYRTNARLVTKTVKSDHMLSLTLVKADRAAKTLLEASTDEIVDTNTAAAVEIGIATEASARKQTQVYLRVGASLKQYDASVVRAKMIRNGSSRMTTLPSSPELNGFYRVYAYGGLDGIYTRANEAVAAADQRVGVVIGPGRNYIWVRGSKESKADIFLDRIPEFMKKGVSSVEDIEKNGASALDLTGCTLDQVLFFVNNNMPVAAMTKDGPVTIVGYDEYNTHLLAPNGEEWYYYGINDSTAMFEESGNIFFSYDPADTQE